MKNFNLKKSIFVLTVLAISAVSFGFISVNNPSKVTICHVPPGNPGNCHEITISTNALQAHLNHGDRIVCNTPSDLIIARDILGMQDLDISYTRNVVIINF